MPRRGVRRQFPPPIWPIGIVNRSPRPYPERPPPHPTPMFKDLGLLLAQARMDPCTGRTTSGAGSSSRAACRRRRHRASAPSSGRRARPWSSAARRRRSIQGKQGRRNVGFAHVATMTLSHGFANRVKFNKTPSSRRGSGGNVAMAQGVKNGRRGPHVAAAPQRSTTRRSRRRRSGRA